MWFNKISFEWIESDFESSTFVMLICRWVKIQKKKKNAEARHVDRIVLLKSIQECIIKMKVWMQLSKLVNNKKKTTTYKQTGRCVTLVRPPRYILCLFFSFVCSFFLILSIVWNLCILHFFFFGFRNYFSAFFPLFVTLLLLFNFK